MIHGLKERELQCGPNVPSKYWTEVDNPEYDPECEGPECAPEFILVNEWIEMLTSKPQDGLLYTAQLDGTWLRSETDARDKALEDKLEDINQKNRDENDKDFPYGEPEYPYVADKESIQAVAIEASAMDPIDAIPTPSGVWKTNAYDPETLEPVYVPYNCAEYASFKSAFYMRSSDNFGVKELHKNNVKTMYVDGSTAEEIDGYDYSQGWR